jgi:hypothetical protein
MEETTIDVKGNFAVRVGKMWASKDYSEVRLSKNPKSLLSFKDAHNLAEEVGGKIIMLKPVDLTEEQIADLKLAATSDNND